VTRSKMKKTVLINIFKTRNELDICTADKFYEVIRKNLTERMHCCIVLSGGETPKNVYHLMGLNKVNKLIDWNRVHIFFSDERAVSPDNPQSNYGMIKREWISHISIPQTNVHRIQGELNPHEAAEKYEQEIRNVFGQYPIVFDLVLLGVGEDGHTASLFPGIENIPGDKRLVTSAYIGHINSWRISLTVSILNESREIIFLAAGKKKASIIQRVLEKDVPDAKMPATCIRPAVGTISWMIDEEAGLELKEHASIIIQRI
jgi:6-phosphogluconolactonase